MLVILQHYMTKGTQVWGDVSEMLHWKVLK